MTKKKSFHSSMFEFLSGAFIGRAITIARDIILATFIGSSPEMGALLLIYRIIQAIMRIFIESGLQNLSFVPYIVRYKQLSTYTAYVFVQKLCAYGFQLGLVALLSIELGLYGIYYQHYFPEIENMLLYSIILFPCVLFSLFIAIYQSILQIHNKYFLTALSTSLVNLFWSIGILITQFLQHSVKETELSAIILISTFLHVGILYALVQPLLEQWKNGSKKSIHPHSIKEFLLTTIFAIISIGTLQVNSILDAFFSYTINQEGPVFLWYASRLIHPIILIVGTSITTVSIKRLTKTHLYDQAEYNRKILRSLLLSMHLSIAIASILFSSIYSAITAFFFHGNFPEYALFETSSCCIALALSILPNAIIKILTFALYTINNKQLPIVTSFLSITLNVLLNFICVYVMQLPTWSIALTTSISACIQSIFLIFGTLNMAMIKEYFHKTIFALMIAICAVVCSLIINHFLFQDNTVGILFFPTWIIKPSQSIWFKISSFSIQMISNYFVLNVFAWLLQNHDLISIIHPHAIYKVVYNPKKSIQQIEN